MPFGGAGPLHARDVAVSLGMSEMDRACGAGHRLRAGAPGLRSEGGFRGQPPAFAIDPDRASPLSSADRSSELQCGEAVRLVRRRNRTARRKGRRVELVLDARYVGQNFELLVPVGRRGQIAGIPERLICPDADATLQPHASARPMNSPMAMPAIPSRSRRNRQCPSDGACQAAQRVCGQAAGRADPGEPGVPRDRMARGLFRGGDQAGAVDRSTPAPTLHGRDIAFHGPAIIEQLDTTTPIYPGDMAEVTPDGHLIIRIGAEGGHDRNRERSIRSALKSSQTGCARSRTNVSLP